MVERLVEIQKCFWVDDNHSLDGVFDVKPGFLARKNFIKGAYLSLLTLFHCQPFQYNRPFEIGGGLERVRGGFRER